MHEHPATALIDIHAHWLPPIYIEAMDAAGVHDIEGFPRPPWNEHDHLALMDRHGIAAAILSISAPGVAFLDKSGAAKLARRLNEQAAELRARSNGRFGAFAALPMPDIDGALREMEYALDTLHLDGIGLLTNSNGIYLGHPSLEPILAEADRRDTVVFTHPVAPPGFDQTTLGFSAPTLEYPFDTTRMILNLVATGTLRRYPTLRLIASHGGGTTPMLAVRMANIAAMFSQLTPPLTQAEAVAQIQSVYCDATAVLNPPAMAGYTAFVPANRRLYGSDHPFMPEASIPPSLRALHAPGALPPAAATALAHGNAVALFPALGRRLNRASPASSVQP